MENAHHKSAAEFKLVDGQKTDFNQLFANAGYIANKGLDLFKKDTTNFVLAFAIPVVVGGVLSTIVVPMFLGGIMITGGLLGGMLALAVFVVCGVVLSAVAYLALLKAVVDVSKGSKLDVVTLFKFGFSQIVNFVVMSVKAFMLIFKGWKPFVNALFAPIYFVENGGHVEASIKSSETVAEGKSATLLWTVVLIGLAASLASSVLVAVWVSIFGAIHYYLANLGATVISAAVTPFTIICQYVLRAELEKHSVHHTASTTHHQA